jgi:hypothetical protein
MQYVRGSAIDRIFGVVRFNGATLSSVARDPQGTAQAAIVVGLVSLALGISQVVDSWVVLALAVAGVILVAQGQTSWVPRALREPHTGLDTHGLHRRVVAHVQGFLPLPGIVIGIGAGALALMVILSVPAIIAPAVAWFTFSGAAWFAVNTLVGHPHTRAGFAPLLRATGFSFAPIALVALMVVPVLGGLVLPLAAGWTFLLLVFAIRHTARLGTERALLAAIGASLVTVAAVGLVLAVARV